MSVADKAGGDVTDQTNTGRGDEQNTCLAHAIIRGAVVPSPRGAMRILTVRLIVKGHDPSMGSAPLIGNTGRTTLANTLGEMFTRVHVGVARFALLNGEIRCKPCRAGGWGRRESTSSTSTRHSR